MNKERLLTNKNNFLKGPITFKENLFNDSRGFFIESWNENKFSELLGFSTKFVQDNHSQSRKGVLRGLHFQTNPFAQGKLVRCISGEIYDVIVDLRQNSETFKEWAGIKLNNQERKQLWVPPGFAHGFLTLSEHAEVFYKVTQYWEKGSEVTLKWDDPEININWNSNLNFHISDKDSKGLFISNFDQNYFF